MDSLSSLCLGFLICKKEIMCESQQFKMKACTWKLWAQFLAQNSKKKCKLASLLLNDSISGWLMSSSSLSDLGEWHVSWALWRIPSAKLSLELGAVYAGPWSLRRPRCLTFSWVNVGLWLLPSCTFTWTEAMDVKGGSPKSFAPTSSVNHGAVYVGRKRTVKPFKYSKGKY